MFTGIIEHIGLVQSIANIDGGLRMGVKIPGSLLLHIGDSVAIDGCCQTVVESKKGSFTVFAIEETLKKTNFPYLRLKSYVNIEFPLSANSRFNGHFVQGHVDCTGKLTAIEMRKTSRMFWFRLPKKHMRMLVPVGSIAVNGVSLTVAQLKKQSFGVSIIPHTFDHTTFQYLHEGDTVNLEFDIIGKYVKRLMNEK